MRRLVKEEAGVTLVEVLLVSATMLVVLAATLNIFDTFNSASSALSRRTDLQDTARRALDTMSREIRNATAVPGAPDAIVAGSSDATQITFGTYDDGTATTGTTARRIRYCVNSTTHDLYRETAVGSPTPGTACPAGGSWSGGVVLSDVQNSTATPLFTYATNNRGVTIDLRVTGSAKGRDTTLRTAVAPRSFSGRNPTMVATKPNVACSADGKSALVSLAAGVDDQGEPVDIDYFSSSSTPLGSGTIKLATSSSGALSQTIKFQVRNALGAESQLIDLLVSCQ